MNRKPVVKKLFIAFALLTLGDYIYWNDFSQKGVFGERQSFWYQFQKHRSNAVSKDYMDKALGKTNPPQSKPSDPDAHCSLPGLPSDPPEANEALIDHPTVPDLNKLPKGPVFPSYGPLTGTWAGQAFPDSNSMCGMSLDLHEENAQFGAYTTLVCTSQLVGQTKYSPILASMTGKFEDGTVVLKTEKTISSAPLLKACAFKTLTLTPFGAQTLAATFETSCSKGEIVLRRR